MRYPTLGENIQVAPLSTGENPTLTPLRLPLRENSKFPSPFNRDKQVALPP